MAQNRRIAQCDRIREVKKALASLKKAQGAVCLTGSARSCQRCQKVCCPYYCLVIQCFARHPQIYDRESNMQLAAKTNGIVRTLVGTAIAVSLTFAASSLMMSSAQATPQMAKGQKCDTCHTGAPPSKDNAKKADTKKDDTKK